MNWQYFVVALLIAAAVAYLARQSWRTWSGQKAGCGGGCGCSSRATTAVPGSTPVVLIAPEQITLRRRNTRSP